MTFQAMDNAIRTRAKATFDDMSAPKPDSVFYDNQEGQPDSNDDLWVRVTVLSGETFQASLGNSKRFRTPGVLVFQIFVPIGRGTKAQAIMVDRLVVAFRAQTVSNVVYRTPVRRQIGRTDTWWQMNVEVEFYADDVES